MLSFIKETPQTTIRSLIRELRVINPKFDEKTITRMSIPALREAATKLKNRIETVKLEENVSYGSWWTNETYTTLQLKAELVETVLKVKEDIKEKEILVPGFVYYKNVKESDGVLRGKKCYYLKEDNFPLNWVPFAIKTSVAKAVEIMRHGNIDDFKRIYLEYADGTIDGVKKFKPEHLAKSSDEALKLIETYCDSRWEDTWPWETRSYKINEMIEERTEMTMKNNFPATQIKEQFERFLRNLNEGDMERYEVASLAQAMVDQVDKMISDLGKISSSGIESVASARSTLGDDAASALEQALRDPVNQAATTLSNLKSALRKALDSIESGGDAGGDFGGDDLGSPGDAMGDDPSLGGGDQDLSGALSDVDLDGSGPERPMKDM